MYPIYTTSLLLYSVDRFIVTWEAATLSWMLPVLFYQFYFYFATRLCNFPTFLQYTLRWKQRYVPNTDRLCGLGHERPKTRRFWNSKHWEWLAIPAFFILKKGACRAHPEPFLGEESPTPSFFAVTALCILSKSPMRLKYEIAKNNAGILSILSIPALLILNFYLSASVLLCFSVTRPASSFSVFSPRIFSIFNFTLLSSFNESLSTVYS